MEVFASMYLRKSIKTFKNSLISDEIKKTNNLSCLTIPFTENEFHKQKQQRGQTSVTVVNVRYWFVSSLIPRNF